MFEKWYDRFSPILDAEGGAIAKADKTRFIMSKLITSETNTFGNYIKSSRNTDLKAEEFIELLKKK